MVTITIIISIIVLYFVIKHLLSSLTAPEKMNATVNCEGTIFNITFTYRPNAERANISDIKFTSNGDLLHVEFKITAKKTCCFDECGIEYYLVNKDNSISDKADERMYGIGELAKGQSYIYKSDLYGLPIDEKEHNVAIDCVGFQGYIGV